MEPATFAHMTVQEFWRATGQLSKDELLDLMKNVQNFVNNNPVLKGNSQAIEAYEKVKEISLKEAKETADTLTEFKEAGIIAALAFQQDIQSLKSICQNDSPDYQACVETEKKLNDLINKTRTQNKLYSLKLTEKFYSEYLYINLQKRLLVLANTRCSNAPSCTRGADKRCGECKKVIYCSRQCYDLHLLEHKKICKLQPQ